MSIIIPTYGRSDRINRAIDSALSQNYSNFEVIVVDDNNPGTLEREETEKSIVKYKSQSNFRYIKHPKNLNGSAARNTGIKYSSGEYITFLDDDDEYFPDKIKLQVNSLESLDSSWGMCYTGYKKIDQYENIQFSAEKSEGFLPVKSLSKNLFVGSGSNFMVRRSVVEEVKGFDDSFMRNQDLEFMSRVLLKYKIKHVDYTGFLVHNEIREIKYSYEEIVGINNSYKTRFKNIIGSLKKEDQEKVWLILSLLDVRDAITYKKYKEVYSIIKNNRINIFILLKYISYLIYRVITKKSFGFTL